jgi:hypothetical protein
MSCRNAALLFVLAWASSLRAQEIKFIDISNIHQRTELRYPPASPSDCKKGTVCGGVFGSTSVSDGAPDQRDPHKLGVYLLRVTPTEINPSEPFQVEFKILNTGTAVIDLPVSANLADLQPKDESLAFDYFSLALVVRGEGETQRSDVPCFGFVELYGSPEHPESMMVLRPGEWIRVTANVKLSTWPEEPVSTRFRGDFWMRKNTFRPHPGGQSTDAQNLYPNATQTPYVPVRLLPLSGSEKPAQ